MTEDTYQAVSQIQTLVFIKLFGHVITTANLAFLFNAGLLYVSIGTFRRHLKAGIARVTEILWRQNID